jgi:hypothetical protein
LHSLGLHLLTLTQGAQSLGLCLVFSLLCPVSRADVFHLADGGEVVGTLVERGEDNEYVVQTTLGARVTLAAKQVKDVERQDAQQSDYESRSRALPDTVAAHRSLAAWCKEHQLPELADHHLKRILELDPQDEQARTSLGYQQHQGKWLSRDDIMAARGMRFYEGSYRTEQDIALRERDKQFEKAEIEWLRQLKLWRDWLDNRRADRVEEAHANLMDVTDPAAATSVVKMLERERDEDIRYMWMDILGQIHHPASMRELIQLSITEPLRDTRVRCVEYLLGMNENIDIQLYVKALRSKDNQTINVAADALGRIGNPEAISPLIDVLVTTHRLQVSGGGNIGASFSPDGGAGLSAGGPTYVDEDVKNPEVRRALMALSNGQDFEYDEKAWSNWYVNERMIKQQPLIDPRRDQ